MSQAKLGLVLGNLMTPAVNLTQLMNTYALLGSRDTAIGIKRINSAVFSKLKGKPNADYRLLERADINPIDTMAEGTRHSFRKEGKFSKANMLLFQTAEAFNRGTAFLGAVDRSQRQGKSHKEGLDYARDVVERTQFDYSAANTPEILRNTFLRVPLQFKKFVVFQTGFALGLRKAEIPRFFLAAFMFAGGIGAPALRFSMSWSAPRRITNSARSTR